MKRLLTWLKPYSYTRASKDITSRFELAGDFDLTAHVPPHAAKDLANAVQAIGKELDYYRRRTFWLRVGLFSTWGSIILHHFA